MTSNSVGELAEALERLQRLRDSGTLSDEEFRKLRDKLVSDSTKAEPLKQSALSHGNSLDSEPSQSNRGAILVAGLIVVALVFAIPLVNEGTTNECAALETRLMRLVSQKGDSTSDNKLALGLLTLMQRASNGAFVTAGIKKRYPNVPPVLGCTYSYYRLWISPEGFDLPNSNKDAAQVDQPWQPSELEEPEQRTVQAPATPSPDVVDADPAPETSSPAKAAAAFPDVEPQSEAQQPAQELASLPPPELRPIARTRRLPPYPPISVRLGEEGVTVLEVEIDTLGNVTSASISASSGSERLDQAAADYVQRTWKWQPPTSNGRPVSAKTHVSITWNLKDAPPP